MILSLQNDKGFFSVPVDSAAAASNVQASLSLLPSLFHLFFLLFFPSLLPSNYTLMNLFSPRKFILSNSGLYSKVSPKDIN